MKQILLALPGVMTVASFATWEMKVTRVSDDAPVCREQIDIFDVGDQADLVNSVEK